MPDAQEFSLPNVGPGPDPFTLDALPEDVAFVVLLFQRDYYCTNCRNQVRAVADRIDDFRARYATPVSVLPEPVEGAEDWQERYDLPYPLLADPDAAGYDTVEFDAEADDGIAATLAAADPEELTSTVVCYQTGGYGIEPITYVLGPDADAVATAVGELLRD